MKMKKENAKTTRVLSSTKKEKKQYLQELELLVYSSLSNDNKGNEKKNENILLNSLSQQIQPNTNLHTEAAQFNFYCLAFFFVLCCMRSEPAQPSLVDF